MRRRGRSIPAVGGLTRLADIVEGAIMYPIWAIHILIECAIIVIPFFMMRNVQMVLGKRIKILCAFFARSVYAIP